MNTRARRASHPLAPSFAALLASLLMLAPALATDLADAPFTEQGSTQIKPNILFILDDSGSMDDTGMPDNLSPQKVGYRNNSCNKIYYNPATTYDTPKNSNGTAVNSATPTSFTAAYREGFYSFISGGSNSTTNLSTSFKADSSDTAMAAHYWTYLGSNTLTPGSGDCVRNSSAINGSSTYTGVCSDGSRVTNSPPTCTAPTTLLWKKIVVSNVSGPGNTDERQNFANWYSYYRTRLMMMKSATAKAFAEVDDGYRVGFVTINPNSPVSSDKFLAMGDFSTTQKANWFSKLYSQTTNGWTPLRTALTRAGRYYAHKTTGINAGMSDDPVQYACQRNYSILTTDGYWNGPDGDEAIGGYKLDGTTAMDNQDGNISELDAYNDAKDKFPVSPRPMHDGATVIYTWNALSRTYQYATCNVTRPQQKQVQWQSRAGQLQQRIQQLQTRTGTLQEQRTQAQRRTANLQRRTSNNSGSSWSSWSDYNSTCTVDSSGTDQTQCRYGTFTSWSSSSSCTAQSSSGSPYTVTQAVECQTVVTQAWTNVSSCTADSSGANQTQCQVNWGSWADASSCTIDNSGQNRRDCQTTDTGWVNAASCTPSSANGQSVTCQSVGSGAWTNTTGVCTSSATLLCQSVDISSWAFVDACTPAGPDGSGVETLCQNAVDPAGKKIQYRPTTTSTVYPGPNQQGTVVGTPTTSTGAWTDVDGQCYAAASVPALPSPNPQTAADAGPPAPPTGCSVWPCEIPTTTGGTSNTLADTAQYYYKTDLRTTALGNCTGALGGTVNVCEFKVKTGSTSSNEDDKATWQHMTTFTMGLGLSGTLNYTKDYKTPTEDKAARDDFDDVRDGTKIWPNPANSDPARLDDLWHAAVNGRGEYFSADKPETVAESLTKALKSIEEDKGAGAAAATSTLEPVDGNNFIYVATYLTQQWTGDLEAFTIDPGTGVVSTTPTWSAQKKLDAMTQAACDGRNIKLFRAGATDNLVDFKWNTSVCGGSGPAGTTLDSSELSNFGAAKIALLSQYPMMTDGTSGTADQRSTAAGTNLLKPEANLVNYLRGQTGNEGFVANDVTKLYRARQSILGDMVSAQPVYVKGPFASYEDSGYAAFKSANANRTAMVFTAANDGMLHAFYAGETVASAQDGTEAWAFIPTMVLPNLYKLASDNLDSAHTYLVDGTPVAADIYDATAAAWKTVLIGGLNKGGKGYYALDITNPTAPKALWEFKRSDTCYNLGDAATWSADCHLGYTFGTPVIGKLTNGTWVVLVTSGYNNINSPAVAGDGQGYLYVLDAVTGKIIYKIGTGVGDGTTPSGLTQIAGWANDPVRSSAIERVYGGDLLGNVWRFDINDNFGVAGREATLLTKVVDSGGSGQPITTKPVLADYNGSPMVIVGTGRLLGATDLSDMQTQSVWAIKDTLTTTAISNPRTTLRKVTITNAGDSRTIACTAQCDSTAGWFTDLIDAGERVNVQPKLQLGILTVASNVPVGNECDPTGYAWLNNFDYATGIAVAGTTTVGEIIVGEKGSKSLVVGFTVVRLVGGKTVILTIDDKGNVLQKTLPPSGSNPVGKRVSWREIVQ